MSWWETWGQDAAGIGATLGAGYLSYKAAQDANQTAQDAYSLAAEQAVPWSTGGLFGAATFDPETRTALQTLSPELQTEYDAYMASTAANREQVAALGTDPYAAGKQFYEQQKALYAPEQEQQRLALENRLLGQGMLGSSGGALQTQALLEAQQQQDAAAQIAGFDKAQALIDTYRGRQAADLGMVESLGMLPAQYASLAQGIGTTQGTIAQAGAAAQATAAQTMADASAAGWTNLAEQINKRWGG